MCVGWIGILGVDIEGDKISHTRMIKMLRDLVLFVPKKITITSTRDFESLTRNPIRI